jgi:tRNA nucleotidyltransferase (CCA-adding enzyme)
MALTWEWINQFGTTNEIYGAWEILLTVLIAALSPVELISDRENLPFYIAQQLHLSGPAQTRLETLPLHLNQWQRLISNSPRPSQICAVLDRLNLGDLILLVTQNLQHQDIMQQYLSHWQHLHLPLTGHDLQKLGYPRGPLLAQILKALRVACLDAQIKTKEDGLAWLGANFPLAHS